LPKEPGRGNRVCFDEPAGEDAKKELVGSYSLGDKFSKLIFVKVFITILVFKRPAH
jgi:hypothetical protein